MHVLISGAGVAGPTLAFFLSRSGIKATVVEKNSSLLAHGQNVDVHGSAVTIIKQMGLLDELKRYHTTEVGTKLIGPEGQTLAALASDKSALSGTAEYEILRGDLSMMLYRASEKEPGVEYLFNTTIEEVLDNCDGDEGGVEVRLSSDPADKTRRYDVLVAADGQWSSVRSKCFPTEAVRVIDKDMYAVYFTVPSLAGDDEWWRFYHAVGRRSLSIRPDPHGTHRALLSLMPCDEEQRKRWKKACRQDRQKQQELVRSEFADAGWLSPRFLDAMAGSPDFYLQAVQQIKLDSWHRSRVVCLGDAGYAPSPLTGMGSCLAIVGSYVLAGELSRSSSIPEALRAYEERFRPFVEKVQKVPFIFPGLLHPRTSLQRTLFQLGIRLAAWVASKLGASPRATENEVDDFPLPDYPFKPA